MTGPQRPTILVLSKSLAIGGAEKLIVEGAAVWDRERYDYQVAYVSPRHDELVPELKRRGIPVWCVGTRRGLTPGAVLGLRRLIRHLRPAVVHAHLPATGVLARISTSVPIVYTEHSQVAGYRTFTRLANRATYWRNDVVIACSDGVAESVTGYPGPDPVVIPNGVAAHIEPGAAARARAELGIGEGVPLVVHVGNVRPEKGHGTLIAAAQLLRERFSDVFVVSIGGEAAPGMISARRRQVAREGLSGNLQLLGLRRDALDFVAAADVFVNPSDIEGLPVAVLEALALGRPVAATDVGGVGSVVKHGETGLTVPPARPDALAEAIAKLLDDPQLARSLGEAGRRLVAEEYGLEKMIRATEAVYDSLLALPAPSAP